MGWLEHNPATRSVFWRDSKIVAALGEANVISLADSGATPLTSTKYDFNRLYDGFLLFFLISY